MTRLYIAGPMTGIPQFNFPAFHAAAKALRAEGFEVISPAEEDGPEIGAAAMQSQDGQLDANSKIAGQTWGDLLSRDVKIVADKVDGVAFLPGWARSKGARLEAFTGLLAGKVFYVYLPNTETVSAVSPDYVRREIRENMP
jgi:Domain of unknown function (DUF4406)